MTAKVPHFSDLPESEAVQLHCSWLRHVGFLRASPRSPSPLMHAAYRAAAFAATSGYLLQEIVYAYQVRTDMDKLSRVLFLLLCHVTSLAKQLVFILRAGDVDCLLARLSRGWHAGGNALGGLQRLEKAANRAQRLVRCYAGTAVFTCTLWLLPPTLLHLRGIPVEFPLWIPVDCTSTPAFIAVLLYTYAVTSLVAVANTTTDAFMATVLYQAQTQLENIREELEQLWDPVKNAKAAEAEGVTVKQDAPPNVVMQRFVACLKRYQEAVEMTSHLLNTFGLSILVQFGIGGWILCMAAYKLVSLSAWSVEFWSMCLFLTCILTELLLYCYFGNEVTVESSRFPLALYSTRWRSSSRTYRRALLLSLTRAQRVVSPHAARLVPLSLDTFVKILKSSYTFYVVLRQTK